MQRLPYARPQTYAIIRPSSARAVEVAFEVKTENCRPCPVLTWPGGREPSDSHRAPTVARFFDARAVAVA
jgi:hypothetical protein